MQQNKQWQKQYFTFRQRICWCTPLSPGIKNAVAQAPEVCTTVGFGHWRDHLLLASEVGYVVFSASFGHSCSSLK